MWGSEERRLPRSNSAVGHVFTLFLQLKCAVEKENPDLVGRDFDYRSLF